MDTFDALRYFVRVVETGSFSSAARASHVGQPSISKHVAALERRLGAQLFRRGSKPLALTDAGQAYFDAARRVISDFDQLETQISQGHHSTSGVVRVAISPSLGAKHVIPHLARFYEKYPDVSIEFHASERYAHLANGGLDVAIRIGHLSDSTLVARRLGHLEVATVASPAYLSRRGVPKKPSALGSHDHVAFMFEDRVLPWHFKGGFSFVPISRTRSNDPEQIRAAVQAGLGIAHNTRPLFTEDLAAGTLVEILAAQAPTSYPMHAVTPSGGRVPMKTKVFVDFLAETFAASPLFGAQRAR